MYASNFLPAALLISSTFAFPFDTISLLRRQAATPRALSATEQDTYTPYAHFASAAYCRSDLVKTWSCGPDCQSSAPAFVTTNTGGDNIISVPYYVGFDPRDLTMTGSTDNSGTIVVSHQGTPNNSFPLAKSLLLVKQTALNTAVFNPDTTGASVHTGFSTLHTLTAPAILTQVKAAMTKFNTKKVLVTGHSLGGALAVLTAVQLQQKLPSGSIVSTIAFASPRIGNTAFANLAGTTVNVIRHVNNKDDFVPVIPGRTAADFPGTAIHDTAVGQGSYLNGKDYAGQKGELHITSDGTWFDCGLTHDNPSPLCSTGAVTSIPASSPFGDNGGSILTALTKLFTLVTGGGSLLPGAHTGPYNTVLMGQNCPVNPGPALSLASLLGL